MLARLLTDLLPADCWSSKLEGKYIQEQHGSTDECYSFEEAKAQCEAADDCHGIATQSNVCSGQYRVTHGATATLVPWANWAKWSMYAYTLDRTCLGSGSDIGKALNPKAVKI